jgi:hypothetical protein
MWKYGYETVCCQVFWFIPPTPENLNLYISWTLSAKQGDIFFGDMVKECYRITLEAGWTFFIPSGAAYSVLKCDCITAAV